MRIIIRVTVVLALASMYHLAVGGTTQAQTEARTPTEICAQAELPEPESRDFEQAEDVLEEGVDYHAVICTEAGAIYIDLLEQEAPETVNNFVFLAQQNYYNNTTFHRVLPGFMAQGGDPTGTGSGGPGYEFGDETDNGIVFDQPGLLAMANAGPGTNGSQFFITYTPTSWLDGNHTIFGRVIEGIEAAELLTPRDPQQQPGFEGAALDTVVIVEDPATVSATPDGPSSLEHFQALLDLDVAKQLNVQFQLDEEASRVHDAASWAQTWAGNDDLAAYLESYLAEHGFTGAAQVRLPLSECPANPADLPIWLIGVAISDYGTAEQAQTVVFDDERTEQVIESGVFAETFDSTQLSGRAYGRPVPAEEGCGANGSLYRLELPVGRYVVQVDLTLDGDYIGATTEPSVEQYLAFVAQDLVLNPLMGALARGIDASAE